MNVELERRPNFLLVRVEGDLRLWNRPQAEEQLLAAFRTAAGDPGQGIVLGLRGLTRIDSLGIATLVRLLIWCGKGGITLSVVMPRGLPREVLDRVGIFGGWPRVEDEPLAAHVRQAS